MHHSPTVRPGLRVVMFALSAAIAIATLVGMESRLLRYDLGSGRSTVWNRYDDKGQEWAIGIREHLLKERMTLIFAGSALGESEAAERLRCLVAIGGVPSWFDPDTLPPGQADLWHIQHIGFPFRHMTVVEAENSVNFNVRAPLQRTRSLMPFMGNLLVVMALVCFWAELTLLCSKWNAGKRRHRRGQCVQCGYPQDGIEGPCPECGAVKVVGAV